MACAWACWICEGCLVSRARPPARETRAQMLLTINALAPPPGQGWRARAGDARARAGNRPAPWSTPTWWAGRTRWCSRGARLLWNADGSPAARAPGFEEKMLFAQVQQAQAAITIEADGATRRLGGRTVGGPGAGRARLCWQERLSGVLLGLSGGMDSALVLAIAVDALGRTRCVR